MTEKSDESKLPSKLLTMRKVANSVSAKLGHPDRDRHFWKVVQLAERWQCSEKTVRRLIKSGEVIAHRFGDQLRISDADRINYERIHRED